MGECIQRLREEKGYSIEELAGLTLSSLEELRKIENGTQQPDKMTLTLLSNALNVYPDSLQNGEIHYRDSQSNLINLMKETLEYLQGTDALKHIAPSAPLCIAPPSLVCGIKT